MADRFYRTGKDARRVEACLAACDGIETKTLEEWAAKGGVIETTKVAIAAAAAADDAEALLAGVKSAVLGWRENDWPEGFDRRTAEMIANHVRAFLARSPDTPDQQEKPNAQDP